MIHYLYLPLNMYMLWLHHVANFYGYVEKKPWWELLDEHKKAAFNLLFEERCYGLAEIKEKLNVRDN